MSKFRDDDGRNDRQEAQGDRPQRRPERAAPEEEATGRSFRREAKIGLSVLGVLLTSLGGVAGLRMTGKMPAVFGKKDPAAAAATADAPAMKIADKTKLSSGPKYNTAPHSKSGAHNAPASLAAGAGDVSSAAGLMDDAAGGAVPADPFAAAGNDSSSRATTNVQVVDGEDPTAAQAGNAWEQDAAQQGQSLVDNARGTLNQTVESAVDAASGMVDEARQALDASAQQYIQQNTPAGAEALAQQAGQAYEQAADAVQRGAQQAVDQARDWAEQNVRGAQDQLAGQQAATQGGVDQLSRRDDWRGQPDQAAPAADSRAAQPIGDGQPWPEQPAASSGRDDLAVDAPSEPPLRIPTDPPQYDHRSPAPLNHRQPAADYDRQQDDRDGSEQNAQDNATRRRRYPQDESPRNGPAAVADQQDPWANDPVGAGQDDQYGVAPVDPAPSRRDYEGYDSSAELFPEGRGAATSPFFNDTATTEIYTVQPDDNFWRISQKLYGTGAYFKALFEHNRAQFPRAEQMRAGDVISAPSAEALSERYPDLVASSVRNRRQQAQPVSRAARQDGRRVYIVQQGDTLFDIARAELGRAVRWAEIYELNRDVLGEDIENLQPGTELILPGDAGRVGARPSRSRR